MTRYFTVATAGHVDHGKTSLLKALTGINPDRLKEEREREMTTDLGFAPLILPAQGEVDEIIIGFIDVPGHGKFLKNMLAGVGGITMALLVVAADEGVMPQTLQHVKILSLLGVKQVIVAINKIDLAPDAASSVTEHVRQLLERYGIALVDGVSVAAPLNIGIEELKTTLYKCFAPQAKLAESAITGNEPAYLPVDRVFSKSGFGKVVTGTLVEGHLNVGDTIYIEPGSVSARVRGLETFGRKLTTANSGQRLAVNLALKQDSELMRGQVLSTSECQSTTTLLVTLNDLHGLEYFNDFAKSAVHAESGQSLAPQKVKIYHGTSENAGFLRWMEPCADLNGAQAIGQVVLEQPLAARPQDRFVLRYGDHGIAGGVILSIARPRFLTRKVVIDFCQNLAQCNYLQALAIALALSPRFAHKVSQLTWFVPQSELGQSLRAGLESGTLTQSGEYYFESASRQRLIGKLQEYLTAQFVLKPSEPVSMETLRQKVAPQLERSLVPELLLALESVFIREGNNIYARGTEVKAALDARAEAIMAVLKSEPVLELVEIAKRTGLNASDFKAGLDSLKKANLACIVDKDFAASRETIDRGHRLAMAIFKAKRDISPSDLREAMQINRKYTMALLTYYDDHQITRRVANGRTLLKGI